MTTTMTIATTAATGAANEQPGEFDGFGKGACGICLAGLAFLDVPRRFRTKARWTMVILAEMRSSGLLPGCGGNQSSGSPRGQQ